MQLLCIINNNDNMTTWQVLQILPWEQISCKNVNDFPRFTEYAVQQRKDLSTLDLELIASAARGHFPLIGQVSHTY